MCVMVPGNPTQRESERMQITLTQHFFYIYLTMSNTFKTNMKLFDSRPQIYPVNEFATPQKISPFTLPNVGRYGHGLFNQDKSILISLLLFTGFITIINTYGFTCERIYY